MRPAVALARRRCLLTGRRAYARVRTDEASEELGTIQVPSTWRPSMEDPATMALYFDIYAAQPPCAKLAMEALVGLGSLRRSLFSSDDERQAFLVRAIGARGLPP